MRFSQYHNYKRRVGNENAWRRGPRLVPFGRTDSRSKSSGVVLTGISSKIRGKRNIRGMFSLKDSCSLIPFLHNEPAQEEQAFSTLSMEVESNIAEQEMNTKEFLDNV